MRVTSLPLIQLLEQQSLPNGRAAYRRYGMVRKPMTCKSAVHMDAG
jgi:hypothetical protein